MKYTFTECMIKTWYGVFTIKEQNNELCMPSFSTRNWPHNKHYVSNARFFHLKSIWITCHLTSRQQNIFIFVVKAVNLIFGQLCIKHIIMMLNKRKKYKAVIHGYLVRKSIWGYLYGNKKSIVICKINCSTFSSFIIGYTSRKRILRNKAILLLSTLLF